MWQDIVLTVIKGKKEDMYQVQVQHFIKPHFDLISGRQLLSVFITLYEKNFFFLYFQTCQNIAAIYGD